MSVLSRPGARRVLLALVLVLILAACGPEEAPVPSAGNETGEAALPTVVATVTATATAAPTETMTVVPTGTVTVVPTETPTVVADVVTVTPQVQCTPPPCGAEGRLFCPSEDCPGGCGTICEVVALEFSGEGAYEDLLAQMAFGPRYPGSPGHVAVGDFIAETLDGLGWVVEEQPLTYQGVEGRNFIARGNEGVGPILILGAHYDSRAVADQSVGDLAQEPVPGAVDGASGVAVLLELARAVDGDAIPYEIWLAFFDMEDQGDGGMEGWEWIVGSTQMAANLDVEVGAMILVDMIGDADQQLYYEGYSDQELRADLWEVAASLGYGDVFIPEVRHTMLDDHRPFLARGIPAVDIIDFDYAYWHTVEDTADKVAPESLERVGRTLEFWLENRP